MFFKSLYILRRPQKMKKSPTFFRTYEVSSKTVWRLRHIFVTFHLNLDYFNTHIFKSLETPKLYLELLLML